MAQINFDKFDLGIDLRKGASVSDANRLRQMTNAYVTTGLATQKRPGLVKVAQLEDGTFGLFGAQGKLHTFYAANRQPVSPPTSLFQTHRLTNPDYPLADIRDIPFVDVFNGFLYVVAEYTTQDASGRYVVKHHYLDQPPVWATASKVALGEYRTPTTPNGLRYRLERINNGLAARAPSTAYAVGDLVKADAAAAAQGGTVAGCTYACKTAGTTSSATTLSWPTTDGQTITDGTAVWVCLTVTVTGSAAEPVWPTTVGDTVVDSTNANLVWKAETTAVGDTNCPQTKACLKIASRIFAVGAGDADVVRYCAVNNPRDWTAANDAGFLGTGISARGDRSTNALGTYKGSLVALSKDGAQVWTVDQDPSNNKLQTIVENVGTSHPRTVTTVASDLYFLSDYGFRSITTLQLTNNLADVDVGSPIDQLVRAELGASSIEPRSFYFYGTGQYLTAVGNRLFVYSFSRTARIAAWSQYFLRFPVDAFAALGQTLYIRSGNAVYKLDESVHTDAPDEVNDGLYEVLLELPYMNFKSPGILKRIYAIDVVMDGRCKVSIGYDVRDGDAFTPEVSVKGNTRPGGLIPVECCGTEFALRFRNYDDKPFRLDGVTVFFDELGPL